MNIAVPRRLVLALGVLFSGYHVVLALYSLAIPDDVAPVIAALVIYGAATVLSLWRQGPLPLWIAALDVAVSAIVVLMVSDELDPAAPGGNGYATWYVAAVGTLMTIVAARRRYAFAWAGIAVLVLHTVLWAGPGSLAALGVIGSVAWVAVAQLLSRSVDKAARDTQRFALAEREAAEWQAAQEAHLNERQFRLGQTSAMSVPMLRVIRASGGELTEEQREECLHLEGAIRDEIRGRRLLNDNVRREVSVARHRGAVVNLYDEGGLDDLDGEQRDRILDRLADAIAGSRADRIIARTVPGSTDVAVTVVGLTESDDALARALGQDPEDEVELWLEIPREASATAAADRGALSAGA